MRFHIIGKFNGDETSLPQRKHPINYVPVNEPSMEKVAKISKERGLITILGLSVLVFVLTKSSFDDFAIGFFIGAILSQLTMFPHEFIHAICFKEDVSMYTNFKQNLIFVVGTEDMSKVGGYCYVIFTRQFEKAPYYKKSYPRRCGRIFRYYSTKCF